MEGETGRAFWGAFKLRAITSAQSRVGMTLSTCGSSNYQAPFGWLLVVSIKGMMVKVKVGNSLGWWL